MVTAHKQCLKDVLISYTEITNMPLSDPKGSTTNGNSSFLTHPDLNSGLHMTVSKPLAVMIDEQRNTNKDYMGKHAPYKSA